MPNINDVIKGLERCLAFECDDCNQPDKSGYHWDCEGFDRMVNEAVALLKAQEPVEPTLRGGIGGYWYCGACNYQISRGDKFCRYCGQAVKWG